MQSMSRFFRALGVVVGTGAFAVISTAVVSGIWAGLLLFNLRASPALPWSVAAMAIFLVGLVTFLNGNWGLKRSQAARRAFLRARPVNAETFFWALLAGTLSLAGLSGLWIVLFQLTSMAGNSSDFSRFPPLTVVSALAMAAISGAVSEEAGFRGYFQGALERYVPAWLAIAIAAAAMIPEHASTQGFAWPTVAFYLLVDTMLGVTAFLCQSILPGIIIHAIGLVTFFGFVWPYDKLRGSVWAHGADSWFLIHLAQAVVFGVLAVLAYRRLAGVRRPDAMPSTLDTPASTGSHAIAHRSVLAA